MEATPVKKRTWTVKNITSLWIGMCVSIPACMLASSIMSAGLSWWQAILNIGLANLIVLIPIQLNSHAGTKYGIPFPVFARLSFGIRGANIAAVARAITGAGWFGIQAWVGGTALYTVVSILIPSIAEVSFAKGVCFILFWALNVYVAYKGSESIKKLETLGAPILGILVLALFVWAAVRSANEGYGLREILNMEGTYEEGQFWPIFFKSLTGNIAYWATLALNIPDFSRYAKTQKDQFRGQLYGLPLTMVVIAFVGVFVTGATHLIFGEFLWDPTAVLAKIGTPIAAILGGIGIVIATLTTNIASNAVAVSNDISNMFPSKIDFKKAVLAWIISGIPALVGELVPELSFLATNGWIIGFLCAIVVYKLLMGNTETSLISEKEMSEITIKEHKAENEEYKEEISA